MADEQQAPPEGLDLNAVMSMLQDPTVLAVAREVIGGIVDDKLAEERAALRQEVQAELSAELKDAIGQIRDAVAEQVEGKLSEVTSKVTALAHVSDPSENGSNGTGNPSVLASVLPELVKQMFNQPQAKAPDPMAPMQMIGAMAEAMGKAFSNMAAPLFSAYTEGQSATMRQMSTLARWGINPFETSNPSAAPDEPSQPAASQ